MSTEPFRRCSCPDAIPDEICVRCSAAHSIDSVIATVVESTHRQITDAEWKNKQFTPTPEVM